MSDRLKAARRLIEAMKDFLEEVEVRDPADDLTIEVLLGKAEAWLSKADEGDRT